MSKTTPLNVTSVSRSSADCIIPVVLYGEVGTGKTCLMTRFAQDLFQAGYEATIGLDFRVRTVNVKDFKVKLRIWDTASQAKFRAISQGNYLQQTYASIFVYDITSSSSFQQIQEIFEGTKKIHHENQVLVLCGNKSDLKEKRMVDAADGQELANSLGMLFFECSAKTGEGVSEMFHAAAQHVLEVFPFAPARASLSEDGQSVIITERKCCGSCCKKNCCSSCIIS
eukprot:TRINITY_DN3046_c0_g1_i1.p1 TRINITY_DN3046_c0_g1~~TRINITY_DN3046_c0_g1_i1.p1  ORF type:complete len:226 (-),score=43.13 TRINITY_DN3046_c0_g1_i1:55-732(-)